MQVSHSSFSLEVQKLLTGDNQIQELIESVLPARTVSLFNSTERQINKILRPDIAFILWAGLTLLAQNLKAQWLPISKATATDPAGTSQLGNDSIQGS